MITEEKLLSSIKNEGLYSFKIDSGLDIDSLLVLSDNTLDELIRFAKANNIKSVFYNYFYTYKDLYLIDLEEVIDEDLYNYANEDIINHNKKVENIDFKRPIGLVVFVIYENSKIGVEYFDNWLEAEEIIEPEEQLENLEKKYEQIIEEKRENKEKEFKDLKIRFEEYLLNDEEFLICTNKKLRNNYITNVFDKPGTSEYKCIFMKSVRFGSNEIDYFTLGLFIEMVWRKYKAKK